MPVLVPVLVSLLALVWTDQALRRQEAARLDAAFATQANRMHEGLAGRIRTCDEILRGALGLFVASDDVSRQEWWRYVSSLQLEEGHTGIQGLGYSRYLLPDEVPGHVAAVRSEGYRDFELLPKGTRDAYSSITYLEPFYGRNLRAFGFDMLSEPVRRQAMMSAVDAADIRYSGRVTLVQETTADVQYGILVYLPVYKGGIQPRSVSERRQSLQGWVYMPFRMKDLSQSVYGEALQKVAVELYDLGVDGKGPPALLHGQAVPVVEGDGPAEVVLRLPVSGRVWEVHYRPVPGMWVPNGSLARALTLSGVALGGLMLCLLTWTLINLRTRAHTLAQQANVALVAEEERFRLAVDSLKDYAFYMLDSHGIIQSWNAGAQRIKGWHADEVIGQHFRRFYRQEDIDAGLPERALANALVNGEHLDEGWRLRKDGSQFRAQVVITAVRDAKGQLTGFTKVTRDITERHQQQERLSLAATVFNSTQEGVAITDAQGLVVAVNPAFERITEYREAQVLGQNLRLLASGRHERDFFQTMWRDLCEFGSWQGEIWNRRQGGEVYPSWLAISTVRDEAGQVLNHVGIYADITRIPHAETQLERLAHHDALTDLPNRLLLSSRLGHSLERAHRASSICGVLFMDLDKFKPVNDMFGHEAGDDLLKGVAQRLKLHLRENDTVARLGGDEFVIVLEDLASPEGAEVVARAIIERMQQPFHLAGGRVVTIGCSVGIALSPRDGTDGDTLLRHADTALYAAKAAGRCTWRFYGSGH